MSEANLCSYCHDRLHPDGVCPKCFNKKRKIWIGVLACSGAAMGAATVTALGFDRSRGDFSPIFDIALFIGSALVGPVVAAFFAAFVPLESNHVSLAPEIVYQRQVPCSDCGSVLAQDRWCARCANRRHRWLLILLGVVMPLLGLATCNGTVVYRDAVPHRIDPSTDKIWWVLAALFLAPIAGTILAFLVRRPFRKVCR